MLLLLLVLSYSELAYHREAKLLEKLLWTGECLLLRGGELLPLWAGGCVLLGDCGFLLLWAGGFYTALGWYVFYCCGLVGELLLGLVGFYCCGLVDVYCYGVVGFYRCGLVSFYCWGWLGFTARGWWVFAAVV